MIATWMLVTLVLGALVAAAAWCASELAATRRLPMRWAWVGGMLLLVTLAALTPWRRSTTTVMATLPASALVAPTAVAPATDAPTLAARLGAALEATRALAERTLGGATTLATPLQWLLATLWLSATCAVLAVLALTWRRMRRARATWPVHDVDGLPVRIAPHGAPMVMGITAPEIVLPAWALALPAARRTLVLAHEREHVAARDPWLLAMAATIVALLPWHPAAWWMASRLARAIETDCDARVLAAGVPVRDYGALLLDVAAVPCAPSLLAPWPALGGERSTLETRILAMTSRPSRHPLLRTGAFGAAALALVVVACDSSKLPTSAEVERMDASQATARVMAVSSA
ncbi:MAG: M56 family metallopeptidase, partial [Gemmatimonadaceae bacterium]|nr:M56 family metallopeptidase [Gemmatimonadaceae bacterium]